MATNMFKRFNKNTRNFDIDAIVPFLRQEVNKYGKTVNTYFYCKDLYEDDGNKSLAHQVVAIYRNDFSDDVKAQHPDMPGFRFNLIIKLAEEDYVYLTAPLSMNDQFEEILADPTLVREIQKGNCNIAVYHFTKDNEDRYGLEFC